MGSRTWSCTWSQTRCSSRRRATRALGSPVRRTTAGSSPAPTSSASSSSGSRWRPGSEWARPPPYVATRRKRLRRGSGGCARCAVTKRFHERGSRAAIQRSFTGSDQVREHVTPLLLEGGNHGQHALDEAAAVLAVGAEAKGDAESRREKSAKAVVAPRKPDAGRRPPTDRPWATTTRRAEREGEPRPGSRTPSHQKSAAAGGAPAGQ